VQARRDRVAHDETPERSRTLGERNSRAPADDPRLTTCPPPDLAHVGRRPAQQDHRRNPWPPAGAVVLTTPAARATIRPRRTSHSLGRPRPGRLE
jgi:hypothetical protein